ncbi:hypothetical protein H5P28_11720 [Ruficoccus amylovorans]|uniref:Uncharacterized protein n=1 Tax=Ruficoccus amylovorans TaxID=1804625 RepID=A0A842HEB9_9BACT|nr:hypothetical protein [Ruficoccus amylovorans]MBC2594925.1 hypothetical protein [Ruficoccus amylovorans]
MQLTDAEVDDLVLSLNSLRITLNERDIYFSESDVNESLQACIGHHYRHIRQLGVNQKTIDPYKVITWFGVDLAGKDDDRLQQIAECIVAALGACLLEETPKEIGLETDTMRYIADLLKNELSGNTDHGIGRNGLYAAFHCAQKMKTRLAGRN